MQIDAVTTIYSVKYVELRVDLWTAILNYVAKRAKTRILGSGRNKMSRFLAAIAATTLLLGCDGANPFQVEVISPDGETELIDANDPNTDVNSRFAYDPDRNLTLNSVEYDEAGGRLIINNLPFDGPDGVYDDVAGARTVNAAGQVTDIFQNREAVINGEMQYYAVFVQSDYLDATSAAGRNWANFGFAGANLNRSEYATPTSPQGTYEYIGVYAATRTYDERGGIELIRGDATLYLDIDDVDPLEGVQGTVVGSITNRTRDAIGDTMVGALPDVSLESVTFNTETGLWENGDAFTYYDGEVRDTGTHEGLIAGPNAEELGGYVIFEGVADIQTITFEIVTWEVTDAFGNVTIGTTSGDNVADLDAVQSSVNAGIAVGTLTVGAGDLPTGAVVTGSTFDTFDLDAEFNAREIGVFVTDLN